MRSAHREMACQHLPTCVCNSRASFTRCSKRGNQSQNRVANSLLFNCFVLLFANNWRLGLNNSSCALCLWLLQLLAINGCLNVHFCKSLFRNYQRGYLSQKNNNFCSRKRTSHRCLKVQVLLLLLLLFALRDFTSSMLSMQLAIVFMQCFVRLPVVALRTRCLAVVSWQLLVHRPRAFVGTNIEFACRRLIVWTRHFVWLISQQISIVNNECAQFA